MRDSFTVRALHVQAIADPAEASTGPAGRINGAADNLESVIVDFIGKDNDTTCILFSESGDTLKCESDD